MTQMRRKFFYWIYEKYSFLRIFLIFWIILCPLILRAVKIFFSRKYVNKKQNKNMTVGFFHPGCNAGSPLENLLWSSVKAIQAEYHNVQICIYTGDLGVSTESILQGVETKFQIKLQPNIRFCYLHRRKWIKSFAYLGSMWVACEALSILKPHIIIDTMGYGFVNLIFKYVGRCKVISYIHNPLVSMDKLKPRHVILNNNQYMLKRRPANNLGINKAIATIYGWTGRKADIVMVNSTWTKENINMIWKCPQKTYIVYPPIGLEKLMIKTDTHWDQKREFQIVNASEFKQENNHELILKALSKAKSKLKHNIWNDLSLHLINLSLEQDELYVKRLKDQIKHLNLEDNVKIYSQCIHSNHLEEELIKASFGIYAKADDHFGSDIIAGLTTGQIMIVHNSGAAKNELIDTHEESRNGYLAKTVDEFCEALNISLKLPHLKKRKIQKAARRTAEQFSRTCFQKELLKLTENIFQIKKN